MDEFEIKIEEEIDIITSIEEKDEYVVTIQQ